MGSSLLFSDQEINAGRPTPSATAADPNSLLFDDSEIQSPTAAAPQQPGAGLPFGADVGVNLGIGAAKGALDTVNTVSGLLNKIPGVGETLAPKAGIKASEQAAVANGTAQTVGKVGEGIAEFFLGDEALKGASIAEKLGVASKVAKLAESSPTAARLIHAGMNALRTGTVSAGEAAAKGASPTEAAEAGAGGAAGGAALEGLGAGVKAIRNIYKPLAKSNALEQVQPAIQDGIRSAVRDIAGDTSGSIRDVVSKAADKIEAKSQPIFQKLDELSGQKFSDAQAMAQRYRGALDKAGKDAYAAAKEKQNAIFEQFKDNFEPDALNKAKADWRQMNALRDVDEAVKSSVKGTRPEIAAKAGAKQPPETVNPKTLMDRLNTLYNEDTLQTALGEDKAHELLQHAGGAHSAQQDIAYSIRQANAAQMAKKKLVKSVATKAAYVGGVALGLEAAKHALGGR